MTCQELVCRLILWLVSTFFELSNLCALFCAKLRSYLSGIYEVIWLLINWMFPRKKYQLNKIPNHIACAFTNKNYPPKCTVIADIALYCYIYGIEQLTVYDPWSVLKEQQGEIERVVKGRFETQNASQCQIIVNKQIADVQQQDSIRINVIGAEESVESLVNIAHRFSREYCNGNVNLDDITVDKVNREMLDCNIGQPDLLMQFAECPSTVGYPPWGLRVCELLVVNAETYKLGRFSEMTFLDALENYSRRNQRYGK